MSRLIRNARTGETRVVEDLPPDPEMVTDVALSHNGMRNAEEIRTALQAALESNRNFLNLDAPTAAQMRAQTRVLTLQNSKLIRLLIGALEGTD